MVFADGKYHNYKLYDWLSVHRRPYRLEVVSRPKGEKGLQAVAGALGGGTDLGLAGALSRTEQRLRTHSRVE